ncbi:virion protein [Haloarcula virus Hardyhisp2]|uniref:Virion protein n=1 Tax=Haloarcula virus Hardyhisp2 TaxID=2811386 RepID=A0A898KBM5_9VIRU|nr:virion protein [Haloarcula virus Hardyhisp2]QSJ05045.1 virion protein [Haloarcula virus Hardyhisp2]
MNYNLKVGAISGISSGAIHGFAHMYFANWSLQRAIESNVTWVMAIAGMVATYALLAEKDNYHN